MAELQELIEDALEAIAGIEAVVEIEGRTVILSGLIQSEQERQTAADMVAELAPGYDLSDNLEVTAVLPERQGELELSEAEAHGFPEATPETQDPEGLEPGDFTDQEVLTDPMTASGPHGMAGDEEIGEGEEVYVPPTDPVRDRVGDPVGGFQTTSMDEPYEPETPDELGDEALAEAVRRELSEDATTTDLDVDVNVVQGVVYLSGAVPDMTDAENVEEVAGRLPGVVDVVEELDVANV